ncbi:MAG: metal-dependent transcriptional regulator [Theionarchaea archaeon]|nr:metal-dependent transcriptional regulator [Theionarchaea archaeon]
MARNETTGRTEDYLEAIDTVVEKKGYARVKDISDILGVALSSVTEMFQKLSEAGYINYEKYSGVTLTESGEVIAKETKEKHRILKELLLILGVDGVIADEDACKIEHVVNPETVDRLTKFVEFVHRKEEGPLWLDHFNHYYKTGEYIECSPRDREQCPVHGDKEE